MGGGSLRCDGAGSPRALVVIVQWRKVGIPSLENSFLLGGRSLPYAGERNDIGVLPTLCHRER